MGVTSDLLLIKNYPTSYLYGAPLLKIQFDRFVSIPKVQKSLGGQSLIQSSHGAILAQFEPKLLYPRSFYGPFLRPILARGSNSATEWTGLYWP